MKLKKKLNFFVKIAKIFLKMIFLQKKNMFMIYKGSLINILSNYCCF